MSAAVERVRFLERQVENQAETIRALRAVLEDAPALPPEWGLQRREAQIFLLLVRRAVQTKAALCTAIYGAAGLYEVGESTIECHVSKLRAKLRPFGVEIASARFLGYRLVGRERFAHLLQVSA